MYCCTPKALYNHVGGGGTLLNHHQCAASTWGGGGEYSPQPPPVCSIHLDDATAATGQRRQCAHHTPATDGEERESWSQFSGWGLLKGHDWQGPVVGICPGLFTRNYIENVTCEMSLPGNITYICFYSLQTVWWACALWIGVHFS